MMADTNTIGGDQGRKVLKRVGGATWVAGIAPLAAVCPDMARLTVDFAYGDVLGRPGLGLFERQCCTVGVLLVNGSASGQLEFHLNGLLNVGGTVADAVELFTIGAALAGFPVAIGSIGILRKIIAARGLAFRPASAPDRDDRWERGLAAMRRLVGEGFGYTAAFNDLAPDFARLTVEFEFGEVLGREGLSDDVRTLVAIAMLAAMGNRRDLLQQHIRGARARGMADTPIHETLIQLSVYAGFPVALNAFADLRVAFEPASAQPAASDPSKPLDEPVDRRAVGLRTLAATSAASGETIIRSFDDVAPDIGAMILDHAYGEIFSDTVLAPKVRELTAIAAITSVMSEVVEGPLGVHVDAALHLGATREEIVATIVNVAPYSGYPAVQCALTVLYGHLQK